MNKLGVIVSVLIFSTFLLAPLATAFDWTRPIFWTREGNTITTDNNVIINGNLTVDGGVVNLTVFNVNVTGNITANNFFGTFIGNGSAINCNSTGSCAGGDVVYMNHIHNQGILRINGTETIIGNEPSTALLSITNSHIDGEGSVLFGNDAGQFLECGIGGRTNSVFPSQGFCFSFTDLIFFSNLAITMGLHSTNITIYKNLEASGLSVTADAFKGENATIQSKIFLRDTNHFIRINASEMFDGISQNTFWIEHDEEHPEGAITFLVSANKSNSANSAISIMSQVGRNNSAGVLGNSWMVIPNNLTSNLTILSDCFLVANQLDKTIRVDCGTQTTGADFIVQDDIQLFGQLFTDKGIRSNGTATFIMGGNDFNVIGDVHIRKERIELVGFARGETATLFEHDFESGVLSPFTLQTSSGSPNEWSAVTNAGCFDGICARVSRIPPAGADSIMQGNFSSTPFNILNLTFRLNTTELDAGDLFNVTVNNNSGHGEVTVYSIADGTDVNARVSVILPATMNNQSVISLRYHCNVNINNEQCFVDEVIVTGNTTQSTQVNLTRFDSKIIGGQGNGDEVFILYNDSSKTWIFSPENVTFQSVTQTELNVTISITLAGDTITNWDNVSAFDENVLLTNGSRPLVGDWEVGGFNINTTGNLSIGNANLRITYGTLTDGISEGIGAIQAVTYFQDLVESNNGVSLTTWINNTVESDESHRGLGVGITVLGNQDINETHPFNGINAITAQTAHGGGGVIAGATVISALVNTLGTGNITNALPFWSEIIAGDEGTNGSIDNGYGAILRHDNEGNGVFTNYYGILFNNSDTASATNVFAFEFQPDFLTNGSVTVKNGTDTKYIVLSDNPAGASTSVKLNEIENPDGNTGIDLSDFKVVFNYTDKPLDATNVVQIFYNQTSFTSDVTLLELRHAATSDSNAKFLRARAGGTDQFSIDFTGNIVGDGSLTISSFISFGGTNGIHSGSDTDTEIESNTDDWIMSAGGVIMMWLEENAVQDTINFNRDNADVDFNVSTLTPHTLFIEGSSGKIGINTSSLTHALTINGDIIANNIFGNASFATGICLANGTNCQTTGNSSSQMIDAVDGLINSTSWSRKNALIFQTNSSDFVNVSQKLITPLVFAEGNLTLNSSGEIIIPEAVMQNDQGQGFSFYGKDMKAARFQRLRISASNTGSIIRMFAEADLIANNLPRMHIGGETQGFIWIDAAAAMIGFNTVAPFFANEFLGGVTSPNSTPVDSIGFTAQISGSKGADEGFGPRITFRSETDVNGQRDNIAGIAGILEDATTGSADGAVAFYTMTNNATMNEKMRLTSLGSLNVSNGLSLIGLAGSYSGGNASACIFNNGTLYASDGGCDR